LQIELLHYFHHFPTVRLAIAWRLADVLKHS
jgi:hypothetical protein